MMAFAGMVGQSLAQAQTGNTVNGLKADCTIRQRLKHIIFLFMNGGLSQVESFDLSRPYQSITVSLCLAVLSQLRKQDRSSLTVFLSKYGKSG